MPTAAVRSRPAAVLLAAVVLATLVGFTATPVQAYAPLHACRIADTLTKYRGYADWRRSLVDMEYRLGSTYKPTDLRSTAYAGLNGGYYVRRFVITDLKKMAAAARAAGARLAVQSAFRSYATQKSTFAYWVRVHGYSVATLESARAGHSEHQLATTIDFRSYRGRAPWDYTDWAKTKAGAWLQANAWKYGFVMSYPKGKTSLTCYTYEPWHYRYVGRDRARAIHASRLTLREYLWRQQTASVPTVTPTPTPTPTPTVTPTPSPTPAPTTAPGPTPTPTATPAT